MVQPKNELFKTLEYLLIGGEMEGGDKNLQEIFDNFL